jgi:hypothetical protein
MSLVDYRGFRLIAMSILPVLGSRSIVYGSDNYGHTIHKDDIVLNGMMERAAKILNIKEHMYVGASQCECASDRESVS